MPSIGSQLSRFAAHVFLDLSRCVSNFGKAGASTEIRVSSKGGYIEEFYIESPETAHKAEPAFAKLREPTGIPFQGPAASHSTLGKSLYGSPGLDHVAPRR